MSEQVLISFLAPVLITLIGLLGPVLKTYVERRKPDAEAAKIYDDIEVANAKRAQETITALITEITRLRKMLRDNGINPDKLDTGPLQIKEPTK